MWFWKTVNSLKQEEKALLLKFSTGSPCVPAGGFRQLEVCAYSFSVTLASWERDEINAPLDVERMARQVRTISTRIGMGLNLLCSSWHQLAPATPQANYE